MLQQHRDRLMRLSTTNISDALDSLGLKGAIWGLRPTWEGCQKIAGNAVTMRMIPAGTTVPKTHLGIAAITAASAGDIIVVDNAGRLDISCWGGVLATGASLKGISGVVIDGAARDIDDYADLGFSVYARGTVVASARGRGIEDATNVPIQCCGVQVNPGDIVLVDRSGVVFIPQNSFEEVLEIAERLMAKEEAMCADLRSGLTSLEVDQKYNYNKMLSK